MESKKNFILIFLAVIFFFVYSYLSLTTPLIFNSPDETANFVFIKQFAQSGQLKISEPLNQIAGNIIHPRSVNVTPNGDLVPGGFLGLILIYGFLAKIFGLWLVKFLTPLFAVLAVLFFYGLIKNIFDEKVAFLSAILLFINPAWWYYASRGLMPNVLLVCLLIIGFYFLTAKKYWLAGLFFGLALAARPVEALWLIPVLLILLLFNKKPAGLVIILFIIIALLPTLYYQQMTYGQVFKFGYTQLETGTIGSDFLPFGFHPRLVIKNFYDYYVKFFWWLFIPAMIGLFLIFKNYQEIAKRQKVFLWLGLLISVFLIIYYGSGQFFDNPTFWRTTIGDSHLRYWLPVYVWSLPLIAYFLLKIKKTWLILCLLIIVYFSVNAVFWRDEEGLLAVQKNLKEYAVRKQMIIETTEDKSIIIVQRGDKLFWPNRRVTDLNDFLAKPEVRPVLVSQAPLYGYLDFGEKDLSDFAGILSQAGYTLEKVKDFENNEDLYYVY